MSAAMKWTDPFDDMSDEEFDEHVESLFSERSRVVAVSLRVPADLSSGSKGGHADGSSLPDSHEIRARIGRCAS
jgi:hypothetical protein